MNRSASRTGYVVPTTDAQQEEPSMRESRVTSQSMARAGRIRRVAIATATVALIAATALPTQARGGDAAPAAATSAAPSGISWNKVTVPKPGLAIEANDVITTGSGFLAVGGGTRDSSKEPRARIWSSKTGRHWLSVPLEGTARKGIIEAVTKTPTGFVAVGWRGCCPLRAYVWLSPDGTTWERLPNNPVFSGARMRDVTVFRGDVIAVGCVAEFHCTSGRVWRSGDGGRKWEILADPAIMLEAIAATERGLLGAGNSSGFDDARAVTATSPDGVDWDVASPARARGSHWAIGRRMMRWLVVGGTSTLSGDLGKATLRVTRNGTTWSAIKKQAFRRARLLAVDDAKGLSVLAGMRPDKRGVLKPFAYWSDDLTRFYKSRITTGSADLGGEVEGIAISRDRRRVVAVGHTYDNRPAIWFGKFQR